MGLARLRGRGIPLPPTVRTELESSFSDDLESVRIHTGADAAALSDALEADAFTVGQDIFFGKGRFQPSSLTGRRLLAHEVTHTIQQRGASRGGELAVGPTRDRYERAADATANTFGRGTPPPTASLPAVSRVRVQRQQRRGAAGGCGVCLRDPSGKAAGQIAHLEIQLAFEAMYPDLSREVGVQVVPTDETPPFRPSLDLGYEEDGHFGRTIFIGEIKPLDDAGRQRGQAEMELREYAAQLQLTHDQVFRMSLPPPPGPIPFFEPTKPPGCPPQVLHVSRTAPGVYQYYCEPPWSQLVRNPACACGPPPVPIPYRVLDEVPEERPERRRVRPREPVLQPSTVLVPVGALALFAGSVYVAKRAAGRLAARAGGRLLFRLAAGATPIGIILLLGDSIALAQKIANGAQFGTEGFEDLPDGMRGVQGEWVTPDLSPDELAELGSREIPQELIDAMEGDRALQQFLWDVARARVSSPEGHLTAEQLRELSQVLQGADPETLRRVIPHIRTATNNPDLTAHLQEALDRAERGDLMEPREGSTPSESAPTTGRSAEGRGQAGTDSGRSGPDLSEVLPQLDAYPHLKAFFDEEIAPSSQDQGTPITPEFVRFLIEHAAALDDPEVLARIRARGGQGTTDLAALQAAIEAELSRRARDGEGRGSIAADAGGDRTSTDRRADRRTSGSGGSSTPRRRTTPQGPDGTGEARDRARARRRGRRSGESGGEQERRDRGDGGRDRTGPATGGVTPVTNPVTGDQIVRGFELVSGLNRSTRRGARVEVTINVDTGQTSRRITLPVQVEERSVRGRGRNRTIELRATVRGGSRGGQPITAYQIEGSGKVVPVGASLTYTWTGSE